MEGIGSLDEREFTISETRFIIEKLPALEGWHCLETIRAELGSIGLDQIIVTIREQQTAMGRGKTEDAATREQEVIAAVILVLGKLGVRFIDELRKTFFARIRFASPSTTVQPLAGAEVMAFNGLEPISIYEVLVRSLVVNFFDSFQLIDTLVPQPPTSSHQ